MKNIKKLASNVSKVAGSALLVGATLAGAASMAAAQSGSSGDLGDYPSPFVDDDGEVDTQIVVGENAKVSDVVGAIDIAGSLGNAAYMTDTVNVPGSVAGWSATNGLTLNRENSNLFLDDATDAEQTSLDDSDLNVLATTNFDSEDNEEVEVEHEVTVGNQHQNFEVAGDNDDPSLHVNVPTSPTSGSNLFTASVEFSETMDFSVQDTDDVWANADQAIEDGDTIELFGTEYTYSDDSDADELILFGSSDRFEVDTGESVTETIDGDEHTFEAQYVEDGATAATITVDGSTESVEEGDSLTVGDQEVRVSDIFRTGPDGQGRVAFSMGSQEIAIQNDGDVELGGDTVDGVEANVDGANFTEADGLDFYFGASDSDEDYVGAGETYVDPVFGAIEFHYGGLNANAAEDAAGTVTVETADEESSTVSFATDSGDSADVTFMDYDNNANNGVELAADADEEIAVHEDQEIQGDDYIVLNSNEEAAMYQVTELDNNDASSSNEGELSVTVENVHTGDSATVEDDNIDASDLDGSYTMTSESIEGMDFDVTFTTNGVSFDNGNMVTQVYPALYTQSDAAVAFMEQTSTFDVNTSMESSGGILNFRFPSTTSSGDQDLAMNITGLAEDAAANNQNFTTTTVGGINYNITVEGDGSADGAYSVTANATSVWDPAVALVQPEDDEDNEQSFVFEPVTGGSNNLDSLDVTYTGTKSHEASGDLGNDVWATADLDSEDNVEVGYNFFGTYTEYDTDDSDSEVFTANLPSAQSTAGMAVTGTDGSLSASGSSAGSVETQTPTGWPSAAMLDSEVTSSHRQNSNMILVGGPAVNGLVSDLADEGDTWSTDQYSQGTAIIDLVSDAFSQGNDALVVAGMSASDTREAADFISNYADHQDELSGTARHELTTAQSTQ